MTKKKCEKQHPHSDNFIRHLGKVQVTLNALHGYRDALHQAYELVVEARTLRCRKGVLSQMTERDRRNWAYIMTNLRSAINRARVKKSYVDAHYHGTIDGAPIDPSVYFDIGAIRVNYPYKEES